MAEVAKWLAAAAGEDTPSVLTLGDAADLVDGLVADGLVVLASDEATDACEMTWYCSRECAPAALLRRVDGAHASEQSDEQNGAGNG